MSLRTIRQSELNADTDGKPHPRWKFPLQEIQLHRSYFSYHLPAG